jgi:hypothetical protein
LSIPRNKFGVYVYIRVGGKYSRIWNILYIVHMQ